MFIIRFVFYFCLSFAILCIPVGDDRQFFHTMTDLVTPHVAKFLDDTKQKLNTTAEYSKKLYSNSEPQFEGDTIKSKMSAVKKTTEEFIEDTEDYIVEDLGANEELRLRNILNDE